MGRSPTERRFVGIRGIIPHKAGSGPTPRRGARAAGPARERRRQNPALPGDAQLREIGEKKRKRILALLGLEGIAKNNMSISQAPGVQPRTAQRSAHGREAEAGRGMEPRPAIPTVLGLSLCLSRGDVVDPRIADETLAG